MYSITREMIFFINLRHSYLLAPFNAAKISSRTVLFTFVPEDFLHIDKLRETFGTSMSRAWIATDCKDLTEKVEERDKDAMKLENAELKLIKTANDRRLKWEKKYAKAEKKGVEKPKRKKADEEAAMVSEWMKKKDRPTHRLGKVPLIGRKVDTIDWSRAELQKLIPEVEDGQKAATSVQGKKLSSVFVEFHSQTAADAAYRKMSAKKPPHMDPRAIAVTPDEVVWNNIRIKKMERRLRIIGTSIFLTLMILFWSIPVAVVGAISNINYLTSSVSPYFPYSLKDKT